MTNVALNARSRELTGKSSRKLAGEGLIPAVVYGPDRDSMTLSIDRREFERVLHHAGVGSTLVDLKIEGEKTAVPVIIKEIRHDEVKGHIQHVDFWAVRMSQAIQTTIPITFVGSSEGERAGGVVMRSLHEMRVEARPGDLPEHIEVDISALAVGDSLTVADIVAPEGVTVQESPETVVASVMAPSAVVEEEVEEVEVEEGEVPEIGEEAEEAAEE
jgi:large subunit ribosomal protein L25